MKLFFKYFFIAIFILPFSGIYAQNNLSNTLSNLSGDAAKSYLGPAVSGFGADINSNWFHNIVQPKLVSFDVEFTIVGMGTFFTNSDKTFNASGQFRFDKDQANALTTGIANQDVRTGIINQQIINQDFQVGISGPTVVGSKNQNVIITFPGKTFTYNSQQFNVPQQNISLDVNGYLNNLAILPVAAPQLTVGTLVGTSLTLRYLPSIKLNSNLDNINYYGAAIQHNPAVWLDVPIPVDLSLGLSAQTLKVGSVLKATAESISLNAGKTFGFGFLSLSPYASVDLEKSTVKVNYNATYNTITGYETENISFDANGANNVRLTLGTNLKLGIVNINVDYSISQYNTLSAGLGFVIF